MGYDMYFRGKHFADGDEVYFRLNAWGMARYAGYMADRGMIFEAGEHPPFPKAEDFGLTWEQIEAYRYPEYAEGVALTDDQRERAAKYQAENDAVLSWHGPEVPGIPAHKFGTNDGWIVTPAECQAAVKLGREHPPPEKDPDYWAKWLDYMDRASRAGGFEVR